MTTQTRIVDLAQSYCVLIESIESIDQQQLGNILGLLNQLHDAAESLDKPHLLTQEISSVDLDARFELYTHLLDLLGQHDSYSMEHDGISHDPTLTGSLADDLTDIYCELKHGLKLLDSDPKRAIDCWLHGFHLHWEEHLVDAQKHLHTLELEDQGAISPD